MFKIQLCQYLNVNFFVKKIIFQIFNLFMFYYFSQVSIIRGQVVFKNGQPLIGVKVSALSAPSYGYTLTRTNGM